MSAAAATETRPAAAPLRAGPPRVLLVANPVAGGYRAARVAAVAEALRAGGATVETRLTGGPGDFGRIAADPALAVDVLAVAGGDGSINEAAGGLLARPGPRPALAVVPSGTANVLAFELGLPRAPAAIAAAILAGRTATLHPARANGRPFLLMASAGFDAEVVHRVPPAAKRRWKQLAFVATALRHGLSHRGPVLRVAADGVALAGRLAVVAKASRYGGPFRLAPGLSAAAPGLRLVLVANDRPGRLAALGARLLAGRIATAPDVTTRAVTTVRIDADVAVPVQLDGEAFGTTPLVVEAGSETLAIVVA